LPAAAGGNAARRRTLSLIVSVCFALLAASAIRGSAAAGAGHGAPLNHRFLQQGTLTISLGSEDGLTAAGTVTVAPLGATCTPSTSPCTFQYNDGESVTLTANASPGSFFYRWKASGDQGTIRCAPSDFESPCTLSLTGTATDVVADFLPDPTLAVGVTGTNTSVTVSPGGGLPQCDTGQNGGEACYYSGKPGDIVTLTPDVVQGSTFVGWSVPECPGTGQCKVALDSQLRTVVATYSPIHLTVLVERGTVNIGTIKGGPINCPPPDDTCVADIPAPPFAEVTLTASSTGFKGWNGACQEAESTTCIIRLSGGDVVGAWFNDANAPQIIPPRIPVKLQVKKTGDGQGTVSSKRSRFSETINCGSGKGCDAYFEQGEAASLVANPSAGSTFAGWKTPGGDCSTSLNCKVEVTRASRLQANFKRKQPPADKTLTLTKAGSGTGMVTSTPGGISCGSACTHAFNHGTAVTLTAVASARSRFAGWSGDCSGAGTCALTMSANRSVTATFKVLCVVPKVKGKKLRAAKRALRKAHCSAGKVTTAFSRSVKKGRVISQKPKPGKKLAAGSKVKLKVSKGKKKT
jgi:PASTA domain-containing protein/List-Bact-rpt repeat protein